MNPSTSTAPAFWDARFREGHYYGTGPTSVAEEAIQLLNQEGAKTVLEVGCGSGRDALRYARAGFEVTGTDFSTQAVARATERAAAEGLPARFVVDDLFATRLEPEAFDAVVAVFFLQLFDAQERPALVNQMWRLARDGGLLINANFSPAEPRHGAWTPHQERNTWIDPKGKRLHFADPAEVRALFPPARFDLLRCGETDLTEDHGDGPHAHRIWLAIARKLRAC